MIQIDMEKPNHCLHCPMCNGDDDCVLIQEIDTSWDWEEQYANSPLQEVEPERKKGRWIDTGSGQECSECHEIQYGYDSFRYFCAFCGADMREGEQE